MIHFFKLLFGNNGQTDSENLIRIAYMEGKINLEDIDMINHEIDGLYISKNDLRIDHSHISRMKHSLPKKNFQKFKLIYLLVRKFMKNKELSEERLSLLTSIISILHYERSRVVELIKSLVSNIISGNSLNEAYSRLEYLLQPRKMNFN